jgi:hypothetical protein
MEEVYEHKGLKEAKSGESEGSPSTVSFRNSSLILICHGFSRIRQALIQEKKKNGNGGKESRVRFFSVSLTDSFDL